MPMAGTSASGVSDMANGRKVLLAKLGLDCHDTGIVTVAQMLRDAGFEVVYMGLHNTAEQVVQAAVDEDAVMIGVSFLSGQHMTQVRKLTQVLKDRGVEIPVVAGGIIPKDDVPRLKEMGVAEVFPPGTMSGPLVARVNDLLSVGV